MERVRLFGISIDPVTLEEAALEVLSMVRSPAGPCRYVVTPNVDHVLRLEKDAAFARAYANASLVVADGWPVVLAARLLGFEVPERVAGSDLVPAIFQAASSEAPVRVFLLGAGPGVAERAAARIESQWAGVRVIGTYSPRLGFENDPDENERILALIRDAAPHLLLVGLGAPKQELWVHAHRDRISARAALCVGATIDFLAGERARAPVWMRRAGLEWLHRMATEPRRLARRYAANAAGFPRLVFREWRTRRAG